MRAWCMGTCPPGSCQDVDVVGTVLADQVADNVGTNPC